MRAFVSRLFFPVPTPSYSAKSFPGELLWIPPTLDYATCHKSTCLPALFLKCPNAKFFILFLHSNGEDIGMCHAFVSRLRDLLEVHVLAVEYPGYGICPGTPSEERLHAAARLGFGFMTQVLGAEPADVILFGRSLGTALALALGAEFRVGGLVLVAPFLSLREAVSQPGGPGLLADPH
ncbi:unnamed protein product [Effrenium voratum]|nr:unnamed protein product [Effrenium voratum]